MFPISEKSEKSCSVFLVWPQVFLSEPGFPALVFPFLEQLKDKGESVDVVKSGTWISIMKRRMLGEK